MDHMKTCRAVVAIALMLAVASYGTAPLFAEAVKAAKGGTESDLLTQAAQAHGWKPTGRSITIPVSPSGFNDEEQFTGPRPFAPVKSAPPVLISLAGQTGRWKWGGNTCYWEPNDSGPNQCREGETKGGRWKIQGYGMCVWDPNDSGPNQCDPNNPPPPPSPNFSLNDNQVRGTWTAWDDGNPWTWEGTIVLKGPTGDYLAVTQQVDFSNNYDPVVLWTNEVQFITSSAHTCEPPSCQPTGEKSRRVKRYPFWQHYYKCSWGLCAISALISWMPFGGAAFFIRACTGALLSCMPGRLWEWDDKPPPPPA
jgi:hypothetical protein